MNRLFPVLLTLILLFPFTAYAEATVTEGDQAKALYSADKGKAQILVQKDKTFILRAPDGKETRDPGAMTVKVGERFYIVNEEQIFIHNVYDTTDSSWVLQKQTPSGVAAVIFTTPGKHSLHCAIHPAMKIDVTVTR